jgi:aminotransferase EvaB
MIRTFDYRKSLAEIEKEVMDAIHRVLHSNRLILGPETEGFEQEFARYMDIKHCIAVSSGTTALHMALLALDIGTGDEVITVSNTCVPTIAAIRLTGATPVFVDVRDDDLMMDTSGIASKVTDRSRCVLPVHLWGNSVDLDGVLEVAEAHRLEVVEDCAQAHGTTYRERNVGVFGRTGCFSFYPTKNLGSYGDAGAIVTDDDELASRLRRMRMYGYDSNGISREEGMNARIAEIQAAVLRVKLRVFPAWLARRLKVAEVYNRTINNPFIIKPLSFAECSPSYHQYVIRCKHRDELIQFLGINEIGNGIHYQTPVHLMPAYEFLGGRSLDLPNTVKASSEILSLPVHEGISPEEARLVAETINAFHPEGAS